MNEYGTTVAAVSTAYGKGGVAIIRVSGPEAFAVAKKVFRPKNGGDVCSLPARRAVFGEILYDGEPIDEGLLTLFPAPHSFTGEDVAELSCHGGVLLTGRVLESVLLAGAEPAGPGEFTKRAFLNGKISLTGAEAAADLINAESAEQLTLAAKNARGALSRALESIYDRLAALLAQVYVLIDYPDEDLSDLSDGEFLSELRAVKEELAALLESYKAGRAVMEGVRTVIAGRPNVGKSSVLNLLLGRDRAIVSPVPGTTRDTVEESAPLGRVLLRLCDTAGLHETNDPVEKLGVERTEKKLGEAELVLAVFDGSEPAEKEDLLLIERLRKADVPVIALLNKSDLPARFDRALPDSFRTVRISALSGVIPEELKALAEELFETGLLDAGDRAILTNARQAFAAREAYEALERAALLLEEGGSRDMAGFDAEEAMRCIAKIDGKSVEEDVVSEIFSRFCVGK